MRQKETLKDQKWAKVHTEVQSNCWSLPNSYSRAELEYRNIRETIYSSDQSDNILTAKFKGSYISSARLSHTIPHRIGLDFYSPRKDKIRDKENLKESIQKARE